MTCRLAGLHFDLSFAGWLVRGGASNGGGGNIRIADRAPWQSCQIIEGLTWLFRSFRRKISWARKKSAGGAKGPPGTCRVKINRV